MPHELAKYNTKSLLVPREVVTRWEYQPETPMLGPMENIFCYSNYYLQQLDNNEQSQAIAMAQSFLGSPMGHDFNAQLNAPRVNDEEIEQFVKFLISSIPIASTLNPDVLIVDAADLIKGLRHRPPLWILQLARKELCKTSTFYSLRAFCECLNKIMKDVQKAKEKFDECIYRTRIEYLKHRYSARLNEGYPARQNQRSYVTSCIDAFWCRDDVPKGYDVWYVPREYLDEFSREFDANKLVIPG